MSARCETCGGEGTVIEFRRFAGEYMAGEPVEVECEDCNGSGEVEVTCIGCDREFVNGYCRFCEEYEPVVDAQPKQLPDGSWQVAA